MLMIGGSIRVRAYCPRSPMVFGARTEVGRTILGLKGAKRYVIEIAPVIG
jgi:hypothetical protein